MQRLVGRHPPKMIQVPWQRHTFIRLGMNIDSEILGGTNNSVNIQITTQRIECERRQPGVHIHSFRSRNIQFRTLQTERLGHRDQPAKIILCPLVGRLQIPTILFFIITQICNVLVLVAQTTV